MAAADAPARRETLTQAWDQAAHVISASAEDPVANVFAQLRGLAAAGYPPHRAVFVPRQRAAREPRGSGSVPTAGLALKAGAVPAVLPHKPVWSGVVRAMRGKKQKQKKDKVALPTRPGTYVVRAHVRKALPVRILKVVAARRKLPSRPASS